MSGCALSAHRTLWGLQTMQNPWNPGRLSINRLMHTSRPSGPEHLWGRTGTPSMVSCALLAQRRALLSLIDSSQTHCQVLRDLSYTLRPQNISSDVISVFIRTYPVRTRNLLRNLIAVEATGSVVREICYLSRTNWGGKVNFLIKGRQRMNSQNMERINRWMDKQMWFVC